MVNKKVTAFKTVLFTMEVTFRLKKNKNKILVKIITKTII